MTLDEISVVFSADTAPFEAAVAQVCALLAAAGPQADALAEQFRSAGVQAGLGLESGLLSAQGRVAAAARTLASAAASSLRSALEIHSPSRVTLQMGRLFDEGLSQGILGGADETAHAAVYLGDAAANGLERALAAPQKSASFAEEALRVPAAAASALPDLPAPAAAAPFPAAGGDASALPLSITVPLEIDGYRLGVAAIEGINRVTRGTGRVELTL